MVFCNHDAGTGTSDLTQGRSGASRQGRRGIFGSTARGEQRADSDIDIVIDFDPSARITIFDYVEVREDIAELFDRRVDVVDHRGLKPELRPNVARDLVYAF